jgi:hypothetical protein
MPQVLGFGGSGAPEGEVWVWEETGHHPGDPDAPDSRLFSATADTAAEVVRRWNSHAALFDACVRLIERFGPSSGYAGPGGLLGAYSDLRAAETAITKAARK